MTLYKTTKNFCSLPKIQNLHTLLSLGCTTKFLLQELLLTFQHIQLIEMSTNAIKILAGDVHRSLAEQVASRYVFFVFVFFSFKTMLKW